MPRFQSKREEKTVAGVVTRLTDKAVLYKLREQDRVVWIPRSQIQEGENVQLDDEDLQVSSWFIEKEALS